MKAFRDVEGRVFQIRLPIETVRVVLAELKLDLRRPNDPQATPSDPRPTLVARLMDDPFLFLDLLTVVIRPQLKEQGIDPATWVNSLEAVQIGEAREAFFEEWTDFFHGLKTSHLAEMISGERTLQKKIAEHMLEKAKGIDLDAVLGSTSNERLPSSPVPSVLEPTPTA